MSPSGQWGLRSAPSRQAAARQEPLYKLPSPLLSTPRLAKCALSVVEQAAIFAGFGWRFPFGAAATGHIPQPGTLRFPSRQALKGSKSCIRLGHKAMAGCPFTAKYWVLAKRHRARGRRAPATHRWGSVASSSRPSPADPAPKMTRVEPRQTANFVAFLAGRSMRRDHAQAVPVRRFRARLAPHCGHIPWPFFTLSYRHVANGGRGSTTYCSSLDSPVALTGRAGHRAPRSCGALHPGRF